MLSAFANCFKIPELRQRILFTLALVVIVRIGAAIPCPGIDTNVLAQYFHHVVELIENIVRQPGAFVPDHKCRTTPEFVAVQIFGIAGLLQTNEAISILPQLLQHWF